ALPRPRAALDRALDVVLGQGVRLRLGDRVGERVVCVRVASALTRRDDDRAGELGEELAALLVRRGLLVLDGRPFGMARHGVPPGWCARRRPATPRPTPPPPRSAPGRRGAGGRRRSARDGTRPP